MPHQVGYIDPGDRQVSGELPISNEMGAESEEKHPSALPSKPSSEELVEIKAIMKGEKEFSKDKQKRARQKELIKSIKAKSVRERL